jgi:hypothetical protein
VATPGLPARAQPMPHEMTPAKTQRPFWSIIIGPPLSPCFSGNQQTEFFQNKKIIKVQQQQCFRKCNFQNETKIHHRKKLFTRKIFAEEKAQVTWTFSKKISFNAMS